MKKLILFLILFLVYTSYSQWEPCNSGLEGNYRISLAANDYYIFAGTDKGLFSSDDEGKKWRLKNDEGKFLDNYSIKNYINNYILAIYWVPFSGMHLCIFSENAEEKKVITPIDLIVQDGSYYLYSVASIDSTIYLGSQVAVYITDTSFIFWDYHKYIADDPLALSSIKNYVLVGTYSGVFVLTGKGKKLKIYNNELTGKEITTFAVKGDSIYAGTKKNGVYLSTDYGVTWLLRSNGLGNLTINTLAAKGYNIFAGTDSVGVYLSTDCGLTWSEKNKGLNNYKIYSSTIKDEYIYVGTMNGVYRAKMLDLGITDVSEEQQIVDNTLAFSPNPVQNILNIHLNQEAAEQTIVQIFNMLGQEILSGSIPAGDKEIKLDMEGLPAGVYFIKTDGKVRKFIKM